LSGVFVLSIFSQLGRTVFPKRLAEGQNSMPLVLNGGLFKNGIYRVSAVTDGQRLTTRLMVTIDASDRVTASHPVTFIKIFPNAMWSVLFALRPPC